ncbi:ASCH domain-containing protein [Aneurinibacillus migulanus]|uniref:2-oxoglutarate dehydrogenase E1 n=2 Tax=Aneurinibacillus migulanus TaxID=47500 RepID=A0A0D1V9X4_ANEMI|nr:ASCH domain-containing protein [Aneurinibacillus migulanus]KIV56204.1 2-oxoglutarate dehydrogenase E1 [Aneurinibacillus migulanus]KON84267.1 2-oxoglutarate dehydrogenase E1 [Aneurinibacillus migulanus]MED0893814.1 ASCH domain-containing protein [Aneurinibacillus migulanus]MED1614493.1 ASCH domain-containing protein [Aneurinibacillus migulanus]SDI83615.1 ASCH domain-containing protein [Aneurinibacillus migulanus]
MKVISIIQPWATLIALGEKKFETRSWSTKYRGELAIHSSKKIDKSICRQEPFRSVLAKHGYTESNLPIGVILATCQLVDCFKVTRDFGESANLAGRYPVIGNEYRFGDYSEGRFAWELLNIQKLDEPIPAKGKLNLWEHPLTEMVGETQ